MGKIKFLVMDVDGTLTDGKIYMGVDGEVMKAFDIKDGYALHSLLQEQGIIPVIITARKSPMVEHRCKELGVTEIHQGVMRKFDCLNDILSKYSLDDQQYQLSNVAYIGDDLLDLLCMNPVKAAGGVIGCPSDAVKEVQAVSDYISSYRGGEGAVRDFVEYLILHNNKINFVDSLSKRCTEAISFMLNLKEEDLTLGRHEVNDFFFYNVQEYETDCIKDKMYESHKKHIDIQLLLSGEEMMEVTDVAGLEIAKPYDIEKDCIFYYPNTNTSGVLLKPGSVMLLYPKDGHRSMSFGTKGCKIKKIVGKLSII